MKITSTQLPDVKLIEPKVYEDARGFFFESYHKQIFDEQEILLEFVQDNHSRSKQGTLRGLHYQIRRGFIFRQPIKNSYIFPLVLHMVSM